MDRHGTADEFEKCSQCNPNGFSIQVDESRDSDE